MLKICRRHNDKFDYVNGARTSHGTVNTEIPNEINSITILQDIKMVNQLEGQTMGTEDVIPVVEKRDQFIVNSTESTRESRADPFN